MVDRQEGSQSGKVTTEDNEDPEVILNNLRAKVPSFRNAETTGMEDVISPKLDDLLRGYGERGNRHLTRDLLARTIAIGCSSFGINPDELIILPGPSQRNQIAAAEVKRIGHLILKQLVIDPAEVALRDELVLRHGVRVAKNITDLVFVAAHEMTHFGQAIYAEDEYRDSKRFEYSNRPTERHANETGLTFCRQLLATTETKGKTDEADKILLHGLPETIEDAQANKRPLL